MNLPDTPPTTGEIEDQLNRILGSARFKNAVNPSDFLELAVRRWLSGKKTAGRDIANTLFSGKFTTRISSDPRVTASNLRKTLARYYDREGRDDVVIISLPEPREDKSLRPIEGEAYTPQFSYNPAFWLVSSLRLGYVHLARWSYTHHLKAHAIFEDLQEMAPGHVGPTLGIVETLCQYVDRGWDELLGDGWNSKVAKMMNKHAGSSA